MSEKVKKLATEIKEAIKELGGDKYPDLLNAIDGLTIVGLAQKASAESAPAGDLTDGEISSVFLANGFTIKPGQTGLMQYVIDAARALIAAHEARRSGDAGMPVAAWHGNDGSCRGIDLSMTAVLEVFGQADPLVFQSDALAALAAKDTDLAAVKIMLEAVQNETALERKAARGLADELAAMTAERDALRVRVAPVAEFSDSVVAEKARFSVGSGMCYAGYWSPATTFTAELLKKNYIKGWRDAERAHGLDAAKACEAAP